MLQIKHVSKTFNKGTVNEKQALRDLNLTLKEGDFVTIIGGNGAGKSTFIKLICRLYEPTEGKILMDGIDISTINIHDYREYLAVVFQDFQLFTMTFRAQDRRHE